MPVSLNLPYHVCYPLASIARRYAPTRPATSYDQAAYFDSQYQSSDRLRSRFMQEISFSGRVVFDVGSGLGGRAPHWIEQGASRVVCIDTNVQELDAGREILARRFPQLVDRIAFQEPGALSEASCADLVIMFDVFEHLVDPDAVLRQCYRWLRPGGVLWSGSIGWYNYMASHCMGHIPIPWCQLLFSERAIIRTIRRIIHGTGYHPNVWERLDGLERWDTITSLKNRPGEPLNMLSLRQVRRVLRRSPFQLTDFRVYGFSRPKGFLRRCASLMAVVPVINECCHSYYTVRLCKAKKEHPGACHGCNPS